jgi:two-component system LytT family sensor kinase
MRFATSISIVRMEWALASIYWVLVGLANTTDVYFVRPVAHARPFGGVLATEMTAVLTWIPLTVAIFWLARRYPLRRGRWARSGLVHLAGCVAIIVVRALLIYALDPYLGFHETTPPLGSVLVHSAYNNGFFYWLLAGVAHAIDLSRRERERQVAAADLEAELTRAQLFALKAQLHPHFLFNTLHSISALVHDEPDSAERMIARLSELLRHVLDSAAAETVRLDEELDCLRPYVEIEQLRFGDRLTVREEVDPRLRDVLVPHLVLQPLVENAVRHGIAPRSAPGSVVVAARIDGERLQLEVTDDGVGLAAPGARAPLNGRGAGGLGLSTTRARLRRMYGKDGGLELRPSASGGVTATLTIPLQRAAWGGATRAEAADAG